MESTKKVTSKSGFLTIYPERELRFKGDILIIDPCYLKGGALYENWSKFIRMMYGYNNSNGVKIDLHDISNSGVLEINGTKMLYSQTAYGDGTYFPKVKCDKYKLEGDRCGVDAGMLCIVALSDLSNFGTYDGKLGVIVRNVDEIIKADTEGNLIGIGIEVYTDDEGTDEEEAYYDDDEDQ